MRRSILACIALFTLSIQGQTITTVDGAGNTIIQVVTTGVNGQPTTQATQTLASVVSVTSSQSNTATTTTPTTTPTTTVPIVTPTIVQQGPVGQPAPTVGQPNGPTPYVYTTVVGGVTQVVSDTFTPTNPATVSVTIGSTGSIMDYSVWLSIYGAKTTGASASKNSGEGLKERCNKTFFYHNNYKYFLDMADILAVALVVESSIAVAAEWPLIILNYVTSILKRLGDAYPGYRLRIGFVTYATAATYPTPLLCKRFFTEYQAVIREMKEDPAKLGVGHTSSGGTRGMAALEGLVAAIELFDILHSSAQPARPYVNYIFLVAASAPDTSIHPQWNDYPSLDSVTWEDIPSELKSRQININSIILQQNLPHFTDLHLAVAQGASKDLPWFPVRPGHTILLSGLPASLQKSAKRTGDSHSTERTPDSKRLRITSQSAPETSPKAGVPSTQSNPPKPSPVPHPSHIPSQLPSQLPSQPPAQPSAQNHSLPFPTTFSSQAQFQSFMNTLNAVEEQLQTLRVSIQSARSAGNTALTESLAQEYNKRTKLQLTMKRTAMAFTAKLQARTAGTNQIQSQNQSNPGQSQTQGHQSPPSGGQAASLSNTFATMQSPNLTASNNTSSVGPHFGVDSQILPQAMHHRSSSTGQPGTVAPSATGRVMSAPMVAQMHKLIEQTQRVRPDTQGQGQGQGQGIGVAGLQGPQSGPSSTEGVGKSPQFWQGSLTWKGTNMDGGKKEVTVHVVASTPNHAESQVETWPQDMVLVPIRSVPMLDMRLWMTRFKPITCTFAPQMHGLPDVQGNAANLKALVALLASKSMYASASWTRPSGEQGSNALFFPTSQGLTGAVFPVTGLPELPKPSNIAAALPAEVRVRMQQIPPDQMELVMTQLRKQRDGAMTNQGTIACASGGAADSSIDTSFGSSVNLSQNQLQQQSDLDGGIVGSAVSMVGGNAHASNNYGGGLNVMNTAGIGLGQPQNVTGLSATLPRPVSVSGGSVHGGVGPGTGIGPGNVSHEMMKSFIQRGGVSAGMSGQSQG